MFILLSIFLINIAAAWLSSKKNYSGSASFYIVLNIFLMVSYTAGLFNLLKPAVAACYGCGAVIGIYHIIKKGIKNWLRDIRGYLELPVIMNIVSSCLFTVVYKIQNHMFYYWDEYSFWGPSAKFVKYFDRFYTISPTQISMRELPSGNALLNYIITFFEKDFYDWHLLVSYAILFFAVYSLVFGIVYKKTGNVMMTVGTYLFLFFSPFLSVFHEPTSSFSNLSYAYGTAMIDFNIAVVFLGAVALYMLHSDKKWYLLPLMYIVTIKNTSIFFGLLTAAVICCFIVFEGPFEKKTLVRKAVNAAVTVLAPVVIYAAWTMHCNATAVPTVQGEFNLKDPMESYYHSVLQQRENEQSIENSTDAEDEIADNSNATVLSIFIPSLRTPRYNQVLSGMKTMFLSEKITLFGKDKYLVAALVLVGLFLTFASEKGKRFAVFVSSFGVALGAYVYCTAISYFIAFFNDGMVEYPRYMTSYYFSWIYLIFLLFICVCGDKMYARLIVCMLVLFSVINVALCGIDYTVIGGPDNTHVIHQEALEELKYAKQHLGKGDRVYVILPDQDTIGYMKYTHYLMPAMMNLDRHNTGIDFTISFREKIDWTSDRTYYNVASPAMFTDVMKSHFDYILVIEPDREVIDSYGHLFSDGMTIGTLYKITDKDIPMQAV